MRTVFGTPYGLARVCLAIRNVVVWLASLLRSKVRGLPRSIKPLVACFCIRHLYAPADRDRRVGKTLEPTETATYPGRLRSWHSNATICIARVAGSPNLAGLWAPWQRSAATCFLRSVGSCKLCFPAALARSKASVLRREKDLFCSHK